MGAIPIIDNELPKYSEFARICPGRTESVFELLLGSRGEAGDGRNAAVSDVVQTMELKTDLAAATFATERELQFAGG